MQSQLRIEESQLELLSEIRDSRAYIEHSQERNLSTAAALQEAQIRIETQLHQILKAQSRQSNPMLAGSLNASSPEGRQTWMELGRLLREEGITATIISENKSLLIQAMKKSLEEVAASLDAASFKTALEYQSFSTRLKSLKAASKAEGSMTLLSSAPTLGATFPDHFLARPDQFADCLEHEENIENGMRSLMGGMTESIHAADSSQQDGEKIDLTDGDDPSWPGILSTSALPGSPRHIERPKLFRCHERQCGMRFEFESQLEWHVQETHHRNHRFGKNLIGR